MQQLIGTINAFALAIGIQPEFAYGGIFVLLAIGISYIGGIRVWVKK